MQRTLGHMNSCILNLLTTCCTTRLPCAEHLVGDGGLGVEVLARRVCDLDRARLAVAGQAVAGGLDVVELVRDLRLAALPVKRMESRKT